MYLFIVHSRGLESELWQVAPKLDNFPLFREHVALSHNGDKLGLGATFSGECRDHQLHSI
jgi:hypothetical protein